MRSKFCCLCLALLLGLPTAGSHAAEPGQGGLKAFPEPPAGPNAQVAADKPGTVETLKRALQAQAEVSPHTMEALKNSPQAMEAIGKGDKAQGSGGTSGQPGKKAIYGDIIIHK